MKIAYLTQSYPPMISGASMVVQHLAEAMVVRGHDILVLAASDTGKRYLTEEPHLTVVRLKSAFNPFRNKQHFIPWAYSEIFEELKAFSPDVIHLHDSITVGLAGILAGKKLGVPLVLTTHQLPGFVSAYLPNFPGLKNGVESALWMYCQWLNRYTQQVISPTATSARMVEQNTGFLPLVISNGMDLDEFRPQPMTPFERQFLCEKYGLDPVRPIILHVGRLDFDKQVHLVIQASVKAINDASAQLFVVGDGQQHEKLIELAEASGILDHCCFTGFVEPGHDLTTLYRLASVFVTASEIETQGLVLLEAMASGIPIVAVRATCIPEIVRDGVNGYLVSPEDVDAMGERIVDILHDPTLSHEMGEAGRHIAERHSHDRSVSLHEGVYQSLMSKRSPEAQKTRPFLSWFGSS